MKIEDIIRSYCEGINHLEFNLEDLQVMVKDIKEAVIAEIQEAEHVDDAINYVRGL